MSQKVPVNLSTARLKLASAEAGHNYETLGLDKNLALFPAVLVQYVSQNIHDIILTFLTLPPLKLPSISTC